MDYSRLSETCSPHGQALRPEASAFVPRSSLSSIPPSPLPQALRPQAPAFQPRAQSPPKQVLPPVLPTPVLPTPVLPTPHRAVEKEEEELGPAPWATFDCPHCNRSNGCEWMIACSGEHEALEWAHLSCVGLSAYDFPDGANVKWYCPGCRNARITSGDPNEDAEEDKEEERDGRDDEDGEEVDTGEESHSSRKPKRVQNGAKTVPGGAVRYLPPKKPTSVIDDEAAYQESEENSDDDDSSYSESGRDRKRSRMQLKKRRKPVRGKTKRLTTAAKTLPPSNRRAGASGAVPAPSSSDVKRAMGGKSGPGGVPVPASFINRTTGAKAGPRGELILGKHEGSPRQGEEVEIHRYNVDEDSRDGRRRRRAQIAALEAFDKSKGKRKRAEPTSTEEDEDELDSGSQARRKRPRASVAAMPPPPLPKPVAVGTRCRPSSSCAKKAPPPAHDDAWTDSVSDKVAALIQERIDAGDHTEKKWHWIAAQLKLRYAINKTHSAIKNYWVRKLRVRYNIDERRVANPSKLVTGLQSKADRKRARELAKLKKGQLATSPISVDDDEVVVKEKTSADAEDVPADVQDSSSEEEPLVAKYQRKALGKVSSATDNVTIVKRKRRNDEVDPDDEDDDEDAFRRVPKRHQHHHYA